MENEGNFGVLDIMREQDLHDAFRKYAKITHLTVQFVGMTPLTLHRVHACLRLYGIHDTLMTNAVEFEDVVRAVRCRCLSAALKELRSGWEVEAEKKNAGLFGFYCGVIRMNGEVPVQLPKPLPDVLRLVGRDPLFILDCMHEALMDYHSKHINNEQGHEKWEVGYFMLRRIFYKRCRYEGCMKFYQICYIAPMAGGLYDPGSPLPHANRLHYELQRESPQYLGDEAFQGFGVATPYDAGVVHVAENDDAGFIQVAESGDDVQQDNSAVN